MSNKYSVTLYRNDITTKDGKREVFRVRSWSATTAPDGQVSFKMKFSAAMSLPKGFADGFDWQPIVNADGVITGRKAKAMVYGGISTDKSGSLWLNPFLAVKGEDDKWNRVDWRTAPESAVPMVFELAPWTGDRVEETVAQPEATIADVPF